MESNGNLSGVVFQHEQEPNAPKHRLCFDPKMQGSGEGLTDEQLQNKNNKTSAVPCFSVPNLKGPLDLRVCPMTHGNGSNSSSMELPVPQGDG